MVAEILKPTVQDLQKDVVELLEQISALMNRASTVLDSENNNNRYGKFQQEVIGAVNNVKNLKLRMAIVAPMKAGKSTIINTIVGQEILPSRNAAMTTLPTEIIFDAKLEEPTLALSAEISAVFQEAVIALRQKMQVCGVEQIQAQIAQYPHLTQLLKEIQAPVGFPTRSKTTGREEIIKALTGLNDIIRLCSLLEPTKDPLGQLEAVPCIHTPFWRSQTTQSEKIGNLAIVDTPGPNEAGDNLKLTAVVAEQLQKSSIVLVVLDFTQLKTEAAEKVKKDVQRVIDLRGKENLYVLINKVDQRRESDMTPDQVRQFVVAELGIGDGEVDRVFEVSARRAFSAANFMQELGQYPNAEITQMQTARLLAQEVFGIDWEEELKETTVDEINKKAQRLWKKSGFEPFLEGAINALMERAAPKCIKSALNLSRNRLIELRDDVKLRSSAIAQDAEQLKSEVDNLDADLECLRLCQSHLQEVDKIKLRLQQKLSDILEELKEQAEVSIEDYFLKEDSESASSVLAPRSLDTISLSRGNSLLPTFTNWYNWISKKLKSKVEYKTSGLVEFKSQVDATIFAEQAVAWAKQRAESLLATTREQVGEEIEQEREQLINYLIQETNPIIERACSRLNETFNLDLSLPQPNFESDDTIIVETRVDSQSRSIDRGYGKRVVMKRKWSHWLRMVPVEVTEFFKLPDTKENYYTVSLEELIAQINQSIETSINGINQGINKYLDEDFKQRVDVLFAKLDTYLRNYQSSLKQAQIDRNLLLDEKEQLVGELSSVIPEASAKIKKAEDYIEYTDVLMRDK